MIPVILSGGSGTRLWPVSRADFPKQFCELFDESLMLKTLRRVSKLGSPWVITSKKMELLTEKTFRLLEFPTHQILAEPQAKNTAAAIAWICKVLSDEGHHSEIVSIFPADHLIENENSFITAIRKAEGFAKKGAVVTLGITPHYPATGYGYIELDQSPKGSEPEAISALRFREKPPIDLAKEFLESGRFAWNAGIFVFRVDQMIYLLKQHALAVWEAFESLPMSPSATEITHAFAASPSISIDYAIMEKLDSHICVTGDFGWSDVGSWDEMASLGGKPNQPTTEIDAQGNYVFSNDKSRSYAVIGVDDLIIVDTSDALLICKKGETQKVKDAQAALAKAGKTSASQHPFENRPWGRFDILKNTEKFKSKVIRVDPGQQLSLQSHKKRAEHWIVLEGNPEVVLNEEVLTPKPGEHVYIPVGAKHRMRNPGSTPVEFVEVQVGTYFGEDDIVRYQDDYKRI